MLYLIQDFSLLFFFLILGIIQVRSISRTVSKGLSILSVFNNHIQKELQLQLT